MSSKNSPKAVKVPPKAGKLTTGSKALRPQPEPGLTGETRPVVAAPYESPGIEPEASGSKPAKKGKAAMQFGNKDTGKKYDLSGLNVPADHYVVRHFGTVKLANGQDMEDPSSNRLQVYDKNTYAALSKQAVKDGKQQASQFEVLGLNVDVLHEPK